MRQTEPNASVKLAATMERGQGERGLTRSKVDGEKRGRNRGTKRAPVNTKMRKGKESG